MNSKIPSLFALGLTSAALLVVTGCSTPEGQTTTMVTTEAGVPGGVRVDTYKVTATVTAVDPATRKVTLVSPTGRTTVFKAGPEIVNFPQIQIGDQLIATITDELVVSMAPEGSTPLERTSTVVATAPAGAKPGVMATDTIQTTATVSKIDLKKHKATLRFADGTTHTVSVRPDVDLSKRKVGEQVVIRSTEAVAVRVEKP